MVSTVVNIRDQDEEIQTSRGTVYTSEIEEQFALALEEFGIPEGEKPTPQQFTGCLKEIWKHLFKPEVTQRFNLNTVINTDDVESLDRIWQIYSKLCAKYSFTPSILRFSILTGISRDTFHQWKRGDYRSASSKHSDMTKKWFAESENSVLDKISENNSVGNIFIAKALYGYRETAPTTLEESERIQHDSVEEIMERHKHAELPAKPDI